MPFRTSFAVVIEVDALKPDERLQLLAGLQRFSSWGLKYFLRSASLVLRRAYSP